MSVNSEIRLGPVPGAADNGAPAASAATMRAHRLRGLIVENHALVWRMLRRFGATGAGIDEAVSKVFDILVRRLDDITPGKEQAFLIQVCARVASELRRSEARRAKAEERSTAEADMRVLSPEEIFEQHEARALLDEALAELDPDARAVFVLSEMEQWTAVQIAEALGIAQGTVASRLRRGREQFERAAFRLRRRLGFASRRGKP